MSYFARFGKIIVDDEVPADGRGLDSGERIMMICENRQYCWNEPSRSTTVILRCAGNHENWKGGGREVCILNGGGTPAVCESAGTSSAEIKEGKKR